MHKQTRILLSLICTLVLWQQASAHEAARGHETEAMHRHVSNNEEQSLHSRMYFMRHPLLHHFYSSFLAACIFPYYLFYPYLSYTPQFSNNKIDNNSPPIKQINNFMNGGIYPSTPSNSVWLTTNNGSVPENAAVYRKKNGVTTYHCRVYYQDDFYPGELIPNQGCDVVFGSETLRFTLYDVLLNPYPQ